MNSVSEQTPVGLAEPGQEAPVRTLLADLTELVKMRLTLLVLMTTFVGFLFGWRGNFDWLYLFHTLCGTFLAAAGAAALNQVFEAEYDLRMRRTKNRPIPAQRLSSEEGLVIGLLACVAGVAYLALATKLLAGMLTFLTIVTYLFAYTLLKRVTTLNTIVGAIPGALPPMIGWAAARGQVDFEAWILFAILFLWQMPHFLAIAWLYRKDYRDAGFVMLSRFDPDCRQTGRLALFYTMTLVSVSLLPFVLRLTSFWYALIALICGIGFSLAACSFALTGTEKTARRLFLVSIIYLPLTLGALVLARV
jgi:protoheme IX farnesyltransferase